MTKDNTKCKHEWQASTVNLGYFNCVYCGTGKIPDNTYIEDWEERFEKEWNNGKLCWNGDPQQETSFQRVKDFIKFLLSTQEEKIKEKMVVKFVNVLLEELPDNIFHINAKYVRQKLENKIRDNNL